MKHFTLLTGWLLATLFAITGAVAAPASQPQVVLQAWQVQAATDAHAQERLHPLPKQIRPGDVVEYEARYVNTTDRAAQGVQLTLPVPAGGMQYLPSHATATPVQTASLDGVRFDPVPLRRTVLLPDGSRVQQDVPVSEYRFLRWNLGDLPAGAQRAVRARMQLPPVTAVAGRS